MKRGGRHAADRHPTRLACRDLGDAQRGRLQVVVGAARAFQEGASDAGQLDFAGGAVEKPHAQRGFEALDAAR